MPPIDGKDDTDGKPAEDTRSADERAREMGWVPEDEWRGQSRPAGGFVTAEEFIARSPGEYNKALKGEIASLRAELGEVRSSAETFRDFANRASERERKEKEALLAQLEARRENAITEGDGRTAVAAERRIAEVRDDLSRPEPTRPDPASVKIIQDFMRDNSWYEENPHMRAWAEGRAVGLIQSGMPQGKAVLDAVAAEARQVWPQHFQPKRAASVEVNPRRSAVEFGRRSFDDLPDTAKRAYDEFRKLIGPSYTKAEFLAQYEWE
ncbi:MAG: hypothetical protein FJW26_10880 [Acidimicrobiia bacterium]|nr:hypothetical protein [Acidimicrobiia bacterium]